MPVTQTEVRVVFRHPPRLGLGTASSEPDEIVVRLDPSTGIQTILAAHRADSAGASRIELHMDFAHEGGEGATPYEVLLDAAMTGDATRFTPQAGVEETWRIMQPLLDAPPSVQAYAPGSWGPEATDRLGAGFGGWHTPWLAS